MSEDFIKKRMEEKLVIERECGEARKLKHSVETVAERLLRVEAERRQKVKGPTAPKVGSKRAAESSAAGASDPKRPKTGGDAISAAETGYGELGKKTKRQKRVETKADREKVSTKGDGPQAQKITSSRGLLLSSQEFNKSTGIED